MKLISLRKSGSRGTRADLGVCPTIAPAYQPAPLLGRQQVRHITNDPLFLPIEFLPKFGARHPRFTILGPERRHASQFLPHGLPAIRRLLRKLVQGFTNNLLPLCRKLVQPVVHIAQRLLLPGRKLVEFFDAFLKPPSLVRWQTIERLLPLPRRHSHELVDGGLNVLWWFGCLLSVRLGGFRAPLPARSRYRRRRGQQHHQHGGRHIGPTQSHPRPPKSSPKDAPCRWRFLRRAASACPYHRGHAPPVQSAAWAAPRCEARDSSAGMPR